jgi:hypothetical protein
MYKKEYQDRWKAKNPEKYKECQKKYHSKPEVKARYAEHSRKWRAKNKERAAEIDAQKYERGKERNRRSKMLSGARDRATQKGVPFDLTIDDIVIPTHCPVFGIEIISGNNDTRPELDRKIPELGYVKGNVQVICGRANRIKWNATKEELEAILRYVQE